jgi:hypothetical protein
MIEDGLIELIDNNIFGGENSVLEEKLIRFITLINMRINGINKTLDIILGEMHVIR